MNQHAGRVAFITGGSSGIGLGIAQSFLSAGMKVAITYRTDRHCADAMTAFGNASDRVRAFRVDVRSRNDLEVAATEVIDYFGKVDILVNNAGIQQRTTFDRMNRDEWDELLAINITGVFNTIHSFLPQMIKNESRGHIVTTSSIMGLIAGKGFAPYITTKFALVGMMEALRVDLAASNIGVSLLCPGLVRTNLTDGVRHSPAAMDPVEVGSAVLKGIEDNEMYIITHPEFEPILRQRASAISSAVRGLERVPPSRLALIDTILRDSPYVDGN